MSEIKFRTMYRYAHQYDDRVDFILEGEWRDTTTCNNLGNFKTYPSSI